MNYLELVNNAIVESGIDLDELTSSNFATTTDPMLKRFKRWSNQAIKEIEMEKDEWTYKTKQGQVVIYPRFQVIDGDRSVAPPANSTFEADDSSSSFKVVQTTLQTGTWAGGNASAIIDFVNLSGPAAWNELFDELTPTAANLDVFRVKWFARYDFESELADLREINLSSFSVQSPSGLADTTLNTGSTDNSPLEFVEWNKFSMSYETTEVWGVPRVVTKAPTGGYDFFPRPNGPYVLTFNYIADPQELTDWDDTVTDMPPLLQDSIVWRTVMYYADYDRKPDQFERAQRRYEFYRNKADKNYLPTPSFACNRFNYPDANW